MAGSAKKIKNYFDDLAGAWDGRYAERPDYVEREKTFAAVIQEILDRHPVSRVLEIGCGAHSMFKPDRFPGVDYFGTDLSYEMVRKNEYREFCFQSDILHPAIRGEFDLVILSSVLEWLEDPYQVTTILPELVKAGGHLVISYPNSGSVTRILERRILSPLKSAIRRTHYTELQTKVDYRRVSALFESQDLRLLEERFFGKKYLVSGPLTSSMRLDVYERERA